MGTAVWKNKVLVTGLMGLAVFGCAVTPATIKHVASRQVMPPPVTATIANVTPPTPQVTPLAQPALVKAPLKQPVAEAPVLDGRLAGTVQIDARYAIDVGAAVLAGQGVHILANNGATIISNNGSAIVSNNGSALVANNGGGLGGQSHYTLMGAAAPLPIGTMLPAEGMRVVATNLRTGLPYGAAVMTDAGGVFHVSVPDGEEGNVLLVVAPPAGAQPANSRLTYQRVAYLAASEHQSAASNPIDEDTAVIYRYVRARFATRIRDTLVAPDLKALVAQISASLQPAAANAMANVMDGLRQHAATLGYSKLSAVQQQAVAVRLSDLTLVDLKLEDIQINEAESGWTGPPDEKALPVMISTLRDVRQAAAVKLQADGGFFTHQSYYLEAEAVPGAQQIKIIRPSDLCDFILDVLFSGTDPGAVKRLDPVLDSIGVGKRGPITKSGGGIEEANLERCHYTAAANGLLLQAGGNIVAKADAMNALMEKAISEVQAP